MRVHSRSLLLIAALLCGTCSAQPVISGEVMVGANLYKGCVIAQGQVYGAASAETLRKPELVKEFIAHVDDYCLGWAYIWTEALTDESMSNWDAQKLHHFNSLRYSILRGFMDAYIGRR